MDGQAVAIKKTTQEQLSINARLLTSCLTSFPQHPAVTDTLDYILGAIYGLCQADLNGFKNRPAAYVPEYHPHLANYAINLAEGRRMDSVWTAGFFFNSGIQRLAAVFDRIPKMLGADQKDGGREVETHRERSDVRGQPAPHAHWEKVYGEVNAFKHDPEGLAAGRTVTMDDAVSACSEVLDLLVRSKESINRGFPEPKLP